MSLRPELTALILNSLRTEYRTQSGWLFERRKQKSPYCRRQLPMTILSATLVMIFNAARSHLVLHVNYSLMDNDHYVVSGERPY